MRVRGKWWVHRPLALVALFLGVVGGCDSGHGPRNPAESSRSLPDPGRSNTRKSATGGELSIPSTGQAIDVNDAVDVVRAEFHGGEFDKGGPVPPDLLSQDGDERLIVDQPYDLIAPLGVERAGSSAPTWNVMTVGKVELGKQLFYDPRLSLDSTVSCASCHDPAKAWTDNRVTSVGIGNQLGARNSPTVLNTTLGQKKFWDGRAESLETQALGPVQNKIEMGDQSYRQIIERLRTIPGYRDQFRKVFGTDVTLDALAKAIACFERTALSGDSAYDRYVAPTEEEKTKFDDLTLEQKRGMVLFGFGLVNGDPASKEIDSKLLQRAKCSACHSGDNLADEQFHNLGVGYDAARGKYNDLGRFVVAPIGNKSKAERGAFKTPTLRDSARTGPYMHDGSEATLEAVVEFYNKGGVKNPHLDPKMEPLNLSDREKADLVAFLKALNGKVVVVAVPILPAGPDGKSPDPRAALNSPGGDAPLAGHLGQSHQLARSR